MRKVIILYLFIISSIIYSQNNGDIKISDNPSLLEYQEVFSKASQGTVDPFILLTKIVEKKNKAVDGLDAYISVIADASLNIQAAKVYAVLALNAIGTNQSLKVLIKAAEHEDAIVRSEIIKALSFNQYYRVAYNDSEKVNPDKEILRILVENADDTTFIERDNMSIGEIAREGIKNWTGEDYGELPIIDQKIRAGDGTEKNIKDYRKETWTKNKLKIKWNSETKHFEMKSY